MRNYLHELISDGKQFLSSGINRLMCIVLLSVILLFCTQIYTINMFRYETNMIEAAIEVNHKRINHRYFCLTQSLSDIHKVKIDTKTGELKK